MMSTAPLQNATRGGRAGHAYCGTDSHERGALPRHERQNVAAPRPQCHPDPDLTLALRHCVAEQPEDAERSKEQGEPGERADESRVEARLRDDGR